MPSEQPRRYVWSVERVQAFAVSHHDDLAKKGRNPKVTEMTLFVEGLCFDVWIVVVDEAERTPASPTPVNGCEEGAVKR